MYFVTLYFWQKTLFKFKVLWLWISLISDCISFEYSLTLNRNTLITKTPFNNFLSFWRCCQQSKTKKVVFYPKSPAFTVRCFLKGPTGRNEKRYMSKQYFFFRKWSVEGVERDLKWNPSWNRNMNSIRPIGTWRSSCCWWSGCPWDSRSRRTSPTAGWCSGGRRVSPGSRTCICHQPGSATNIRESDGH